MLLYDLFFLDLGNTISTIASNINSTHSIVTTTTTTTNSLNNFGNQNISILLNNNHPIQLGNVSSSTQQYNTCNLQFNEYLNYHHQSNIAQFNLQNQHLTATDYNNHPSDELNSLLEGLDYTNNNHHNSINPDNNQNIFNNNQITFKNEYTKYINQNEDHVSYENQSYCNNANNNVNNYQIQPYLEHPLRLPIQPAPINNNILATNLKLDNKLGNNDFGIQQFQSTSVDILNKVLNNELPNDNQFVGYHDTNDIKNIVENDDDDSDDYIRKTDLDPKMKNKKRGIQFNQYRTFSKKNLFFLNFKGEKINCNVCGCPSSGYHYGSHTCEACKLFFRRTVKNGRKIAFNECRTKDCRIDYKSRSNCSECRYKKCIAVGMSMSRSRFGRHTQRTGSMYPSNTAESLTKLMESVKQEIFHKNNTTNIEFLNYLNEIIIDFYERSLKLLTKNQKSINENSSFFTLSKARSYNNLFKTSPSSSQSSMSSSLSEISSLITSNSTRSSFERMNNTDNNVIFNEANSIKLPECVLVFFCVLFEINIHFMNARLIRVKRNYENFLKSKIDLILKKNKFAELLKIGLFIKSIDSLLNNNNNNFCNDIKNQMQQQQQLQINDSFDKRLTDLMRSEFALFRFESNSNTVDFQSYLGLLCSGLDQILIQNMTIREMEVFLINKFI
jgi:hypothetical protein